MSTANDRRVKAWGRGPRPLHVESLEPRQLLAAQAIPSLPDITNTTFTTSQNLDWGDSFHALGTVTNQGDAATSTPFNVGIYASTTPAVGADAILLGKATIPAGLAPGAKASFDQLVNLPSASLPNVDASGHIYINTVVDPEKTLTESNTSNNSGNGEGIDTSVVTITPHLPAVLVGTSLGVSPDQSTWGSTVQLTAQITNSGQGDAPATRASIVLTPSGTTPGGLGDVTLGHLDVPALAAGKSTTIVESLTLPSIPPTTLVGGSTYTLSISTDSDFQTNPITPHIATKGLGFDMTQISIATPADLVLNSATRPDLTVVSVTAPTLPIALGQSFQVTSNIQNNGKLDTGPVVLRYLLVGTDGAISNAIFLADTTLNGLKAGYGQSVVQTLQLPAKLPSGVTLNSTGSARIAVIANPENTIDELSTTNNLFASNAIAVQYVNSSGTLVNPTATPTSQAAAAAATNAAIKAAHLTPKQAAQVRLAAKAKTLTAEQKRIIAAKQYEGHSITHNIKAFPKRVVKYFKDLF